MPVHLSFLLNRRGYMLGPRLGKGSYAKVKLGERVRDGRIVAIKIINRRKAAKEFVEKFLPRELSIQLCLSHKNIIRVYEVINQVDIVCVVMEHAGGGDLLDYVKRRGWLTETHAGNIFAQICSGVQYLHGRSICHRDLKCENILLRRDFTVALSDFGFSRRLATPDTLSDTYCGSAAYASPALLRGQPYRPLCNDLWSLGCVLYVMITGRMPFYHKNTKKMMYRQLKGKVNFPEHKHVTNLCRDVISHILEPNATKRYNINAVIRHPWVEPYISCDDVHIEGDTKSIMPQSSTSSSIYTVCYEDVQMHLTAKHREHFEGPSEDKTSINSPGISFKDTVGVEDSTISEFSIVSNNSEVSLTSEASQDVPESCETGVRSLSRMPGEECILRKQPSNSLSGTENKENIIEQSKNVQKPKGWRFLFWNSQSSTATEKDEGDDEDAAKTHVKICPGENCLLPISKPRIESARKVKQSKRDENNGHLKKHCNKVLRIPNGTHARLISPEVKSEGGQGLHFVTHAPRDHAHMTRMHNKLSNHKDTPHGDVSMETHPHGDKNVFCRESEVKLDNSVVHEHQHGRMIPDLRHPKSFSEPTCHTERHDDICKPELLFRPSSVQTFSLNRSYLPRPFKKHHHQNIAISNATTALHVMHDTGSVGSSADVTTQYASVYQDIPWLEPSIASDKIADHQDDIISNQSLFLNTTQTQKDPQTRMSTEEEHVTVKSQCSDDNTLSNQPLNLHDEHVVKPNDSSEGIADYITIEEPLNADPTTLSELLKETKHHNELIKRSTSLEGFQNRPSQTNMSAAENRVSQDSSLSEKTTSHQNDSFSEKSNNTKQRKTLSRKISFHPTNKSSDSTISTPKKHTHKVGRVSLMRRKFESQEASTSVSPDKTSRG